MTLEERAKTAHFLKGHAVANAPLWLVLLDATKGDPLRAQEMEAGLSRVWWERYQVYRDEYGRAMKYLEAKAKAKHGRRKA